MFRISFKSKNKNGTYDTRYINVDSKGELLSKYEELRKNPKIYSIEVFEITFKKFDIDKVFNAFNQSDTDTSSLN